MCVQQRGWWDARMKKHDQDAEEAVSATENEAYWQYRVRRMLPEDLPRVADIWRAQQAMPPWLEDGLRDILSRLISSQHLLGAVVERLRAPGEPWQLAAFGLGCFMGDELRMRYLARPFPFLALHVLEQAMNGRVEETLLSRQEVARRHASPPPRLDYLVLCWLHDNYDFSGLDARHLLLNGIRIMDRYMTGFRLRSLLLEGWAKYRVAFELAGFSRLRTDFDGAHLPPHHQALLKDPRYKAPIHGYYTLQDAMSQLQLSPLSHLFTFNEPVLQLTDSQKAVLDLAVDGYSDRAIAAILNISRNAVHMRWRGIYEKAARFLPELAQAEEHCCAQGCRGMEKRRIVVQYIRDHPQEIRPWIQMPGQQA